MTVLTENETKKLLAGYGIPVTRGNIATNADEALDIALSIGFPVAMKISSPDITHKTDVGGVLLDVGQDDIRTKYDELVSNIRASVPEARIEGVLVQQMAQQGREVIIGLKKDAQFGHALMFGLGGIFVEVYRDVSFRIVPIDRNDGLRMISEIKGYPILKGIRGRKPADINAIADVLVSVSEMAGKEKITELDINPLIVGERGAIAVDARAILE
ncbi:MAG: acetate--CoA ligase family protein [Candidatus Methanoperedenaceae archaeon]|nr:acetate--CoA ligase family protein [Candidatus Methanoperedenaceae archaeon]